MIAVLKIVPQPSGRAFEICCRCAGKLGIWLHEIHAGQLPHVYGSTWPVVFLALKGWRTEPAESILCPACLKVDEEFVETELTPKPEPLRVMLPFPLSFGGTFSIPPTEAADNQTDGEGNDGD